MHVCVPIAEDCVNLKDSYGEICVHCNACGRFDKGTQRESALAVLERHLEELEETKSMMDLKRKNIESSINSYKEKIAKLVGGEGVK